MQATEIALSKNAIRVLEARYLRRDTHRHIIETPRELFERVAISHMLTGARGSLA